MTKKEQYWFNVFGRSMSVIRQDEQWLLFNEPAVGMRTRVYDVVLPSDLSNQQLASYLADIYHEYASDKHPEVIEK